MVDLLSGQMQLPPELQSIIDKTLSYATSTIPGARGQTRAQGEALTNLAHTVGGVYGNQLSAETTRLGQNIQAQSAENANLLGRGELGVNQGKLDLANKTTFMPMPKGVGAASGSPFDIKKAIEDYLRR